MASLKPSNCGSRIRVSLCWACSGIRKSAGRPTRSLTRSLRVSLRQPEMGRGSGQLGAQPRSFEVVPNLLRQFRHPVKAEIQNAAGEILDSRSRGKYAVEDK